MFWTEDMDPARAELEGTGQAIEVGVDVLEEVETPAALAAVARAVVRAALEELGWPLPPVEVAVTFTDDQRIHELNYEFRGVDRPTDVLSFPLLEPEELEDLRSGRVPYGYPIGAVVALGDIVVSLPEAHRAAERYGHTVEREVGFLVTHGLLHLLGFDHDDAPGERLMQALTERALARLGLTRGEE